MNTVPPNFAKDDKVTGLELGDSTEKVNTSEDVVVVAEDHASFDNDKRPGVMTRLGLTASSFKRRTGADANNSLNQTLKVSSPNARMCRLYR